MRGLRGPRDGSYPAVTQAAVRIRSVRLKGSDAKLLIFPDLATRDRINAMSCARDTIDRMDGRPIVGIAIVVWDADGSSTAALRQDGSRGRIPSIALPEFVRARLMGEKVCEWALEWAKE